MRKFLGEGFKGTAWLAEFRYEYVDHDMRAKSDSIGRTKAFLGCDSLKNTAREMPWITPRLKASGPSGRPDGPLFSQPWCAMDELERHPTSKKGLSPCSFVRANP